MTITFKLFSRLLIAAALWLGLCFGAAAHGPNQSYIYLDVTDSTLTGRYEAGIADLDAAIGLTGDSDAEITEAEARAAQSAINAYLVEHLQIGADGTRFTLTPGETTFANKNGIVYALIAFEVAGFDATPDMIQMTYTGMWQTFGNDHQVFGLLGSNTRIGLESNEANIAVVFTETATTQNVNLINRPWTDLLVSMINQGVWHMWLGLDHVLFVLALLIPTVMLVSGRRWDAAPDMETPLRTVLKLGVAFILGLSVTLGLASFGLITLPEWLAKSLIALSIAYLALTLLLPQLYKNIGPAVILFGLFHGFGFALSLDAINVEPNQKLATFAGFNIGVGLGFAAIVAVVFPILYVLRTTPIYIWGVMRAGGLGLIAMALIRFEERAIGYFDPIIPTIKTIIGL